MASIIDRYKPALFLITDPDNSDKVLVRIGTDKKLEIDESLSKDEIMSSFWQQVVRWGDVPETEHINNKAMLILLFAKTKRLLTNMKNEKDNVQLTENLLEVNNLLEQIEELFH